MVLVQGHLSECVDGDSHRWGEDHNGAGIDHNAWGVSAGAVAVAADSSSPVMTNPGMRTKLQTALGARSAITKDGASIQVVRDGKRKEKNALQANNKGFCSKGLARSELTHQQ